MLCYYYYQGGWENDETVLEAASREAMEEAGVKGILRVSFQSSRQSDSKSLFIIYWSFVSGSSFRSLGI